MIKMKTVNFDGNLVKNHIKNENWPELGLYIKELFKIELGSDGQPQKLNVNGIESFREILLVSLENINEERLKSLLVEALRALRNSCTNPDNQKLISEDSTILQSLEQLSKVVSAKEQFHEAYNKLFLQLLLNLIASNREVAQKIYPVFWSFIKHCIKAECFFYETSALLYNISIYNSIEDLSNEEVDKLCASYKKEEKTEFVQFFLEKYIIADPFWKLYNSLNNKSKIICLQLIRELQINNKLKSFPTTGLDILKDKFINSSNLIFQTKIMPESDSPFEISLVLEILSSISSEDQSLKMLQDKEILIQAAVLLINLHRLGKSGDNCFAPMQKLGEIRQPNEEIQEHPAFGFKRDLIRLIGNLCWKNRKMQDLVREAEVIPVLLDCCNIDARNPFIIQWVIFAVRNLCENNPENQSFMSSLKQQGTVNSSVLEELGLTIHNDGGTNLKMVDLEALRKHQDKSK